MTGLVAKFAQFLKDDEASEFYLTGIAGTGKTTSLSDLVVYCRANDIGYVVCAYTHKACDVLESKLPKKANIKTLHSYLTKRPSVNDKAVKSKEIDYSQQMQEPEKVRVVFIDEYSMIGEKDFISIADLQYEEDCNVVKVVYIGDPNQLPPVKDLAVIEPQGDYWVKLTKIYRQNEDNLLIDNLVSLNSYINGEESQPLVEHDNFIRRVDIVKEYNRCTGHKAILAYTNKKVQELNQAVQGYELPNSGDDVFSPTSREAYTVLAEAEEEDVSAIQPINPRLDVLTLNSKYKTLETLLNMKGLSFYYLETDKKKEITLAVVFGHYNFLEMQKELGEAAVNANKVITKQFNQEAKAWSDSNKGHPLARVRGKAWSRYMAFKNYVFCLDFTHATTVHKSQGSTYEYVFIDTEDLGVCANINYLMYLKLLYVAISRASNTVYTN